MGRGRKREHGRGVLSCPDTGDPALPIGNFLFSICFEQKGKQEFGLTAFTRLCVEEENWCGSENPSHGAQKEKNTVHTPAFRIQKSNFTAKVGQDFMFSVF